MAKQGTEHLLAMTFNAGYRRGSDDTNYTQVKWVHPLYLAAGEIDKITGIALVLVMAHIEGEPLKEALAGASGDLVNAANTIQGIIKNAPINFTPEFVETISKLGEQTNALRNALNALEHNENDNGDALYLWAQIYSKQEFVDLANSVWELLPTVGRPTDSARKYIGEHLQTIMNEHKVKQGVAVKRLIKRLEDMSHDSHGNLPELEQDALARLKSESAGYLRKCRQDFRNEEKKRFKSLGTLGIKIDGKLVEG